jgi:thioredoxin 1
VNELGGEYEGRVGFAKVNVDDNPKIATEYGIRSIPTLLIFKDSKPLTQIVGLRPKAELKKQLDGVLTGKG